nr:papain-like cysteine protease family protein [Clostridia bacterium]
MDEDGNLKGYNLYEGAESGLIAACIRAGIPVMIGWNEWSGHWQVIIGYDGMGTPETQDDVLILADPYDTNDHNQDGYVVESFERLVYGWGAAFDERGENVFLIAAPELDF